MGDIMDEKEKMPPEDGYVQRPAWQVWGARVGVVIFIGIVILQVLSIMRGGL